MLIIKKYYEKFHGHKLDNLRGNTPILLNTQFAKTHKEELNNLNRSISIKEIETIITKQKAAGFTCEFYQTFKGEIIQIL